MRVDALNLSPDQIDHPQIAQAAERHAEAQATLTARTRELQRLQDPRAEDRAKERDAEAALDGKRPQHLAAHRKAIESAEHEARVARLAADRAHHELQAAVDEHGAAWAEELKRQAQVVDQAWSAAVAALEGLHAERVRAHAKLKAAGGESKPLGVVQLKPGNLGETATGERLTTAVAVLTDDPAARHRARVTVSPEVLLAALQTLGEPEDIPEWRPGGYVAQLFKIAGDHAQAVQRGYAPEEIRTGKLPGSIADQSRHFINGVPRLVEPVTAGVGDE